MEVSSAVNEPHPDGDPAEDFFAGEEKAEPRQTPPPGPSDPVAEAEQYEREKQGEPEPEPAAAAAASNGGEEPATRGTLEREYVVFQKVTLSEKVLKHLLQQVEKGEVAQPRVALFELHRVFGRNDRHACSLAYASHADALGESCDLVAASARSLKERHLEPEEVPAAKRMRVT